MQGQGTIVGVGAMEYPAEFQGASEERLAEIGVSRIITLTSTYDHRIIQGAESGEFLRRVHGLLLGGPTVDGVGFYDEIFTALRVPYEPVRWVQDIPEGAVDKTARVIELIDAYRTRGHLMADTDPLNYRQRRHPDLDVLSHGLTLWDLDRTFATGGFGGQQHMKLRDVLGLLRDSYVRTVGTEYMHIADPEQRAWLQERIEVPHQKPAVVEQKYVLAKLNAAEAFETFLQTKYIGQKRFSLEGGETVIPLLDAVLDKAAEHELDEVVIGMPHRGRLNVLANIVGKPISQIFREFEGNLDPGQAHGSGDVKYHLGAEGKYFRMFGDGETTVSLASNPSHLEAVDPVLEGIVRAKQDLLDMGEGGYTVMPLMLHGDAAFAGQGVVAETLNLALLRGYRTGGTVHVVINNNFQHGTLELDTCGAGKVPESRKLDFNGGAPGRHEIDPALRFNATVRIILISGNPQVAEPPCDRIENVGAEIHQHAAAGFPGFQKEACRSGPVISDALLHRHSANGAVYASGDELAHEPVARAEAADHGGPQDGIRCVRGRNHAIALGNRDRHRFLDEDVTALFEQGDACRRMQLIRKRNQCRVTLPGNVADVTRHLHVRGGEISKSARARWSASITTVSFNRGPGPAPVDETLRRLFHSRRYQVESWGESQADRVGKRRRSFRKRPVIRRMQRAGPGDRLRSSRRSPHEWA